MTDEPTTGGQAEGTPSTEQAPDAPTMIEVNGQSLTLDQAKLNYEASQREMRERQQEAADARKQVDEYKQWADPIREQYHADAEYKRRFDELYATDEGAQQQHTLSPEVQKVNAMEQRIERFETERAFDQIRAKQLPLDQAQEVEVLKHMHTTGQKDVEAAYWKLYGDKVVAEARSNAVKQTADHIAETRDTYEPPAKGSAPQRKAVDASKLSPDDHFNAAVQRINEGLFGE